ncbi:hypothetical protein ACWEWG_17375 [Streptomyces sp. NPDC003758]
MGAAAPEEGAEGEVGDADPDSGADGDAGPEADPDTDGDGDTAPLPAAPGPLCVPQPASRRAAAATAMTVVR